MEIRHAEEITLAPNIVFCNHYAEGMTLPVDYKLDSRYIYDYELEIITDADEGYMIQNGKKITLQKGDVFFRRPGETTKGIMKYSSYICCFEPRKTGRKFKTSYDLMKPKSFLKPVHHVLLDDLPSQFHTSYFNRYLNQFKEILNCYITPHTGSEVYMSSLVIQLLYQLNQELNEVIDHRHKKAKVIKEVIQYIDQNLDQSLNLTLLSQKAHLSPTYFHQIFSKIVGQSPQSFIAEHRVNAAKQLLLHTDETIKVITFKVGFKDTSYFCYAFKRETGFSPQKFREANQMSFIDS